jgi:hypothetical protein
VSGANACRVWPGRVFWSVSSAVPRSISSGELGSGGIFCYYYLCGGTDATCLYWNDENSNKKYTYIRYFGLVLVYNIDFLLLQLNILNNSLYASYVHLFMYTSLNSSKPSHIMSMAPELNCCFCFLCSPWYHMHTAYDLLRTILTWILCDWCVCLAVGSSAFLSRPYDKIEICCCSCSM